MATNEDYTTLADTLNGWFNIIVIQLKNLAELTTVSTKAIELPPTEDVLKIKAFLEQINTKEYFSGSERKTINSVIENLNIYLSGTPIKTKTTKQDYELVAIHLRRIFSFAIEQLGVLSTFTGTGATRIPNIKSILVLRDFLKIARKIYLNTNNMTAVIYDLDKMVDAMQKAA